MRLTVLGSGAACPPGGQNSSGYLLTDGGQSILLDCGQGVASALLKARPAFGLDHIIISHMHADHFIDVLPLRFRVTRDMAGLAQGEPRTTLHLPPGGVATLKVILEAVTFPGDFCSNTFRIREYDPAATLELGPLRVRFAPTAHYIPAWAIRIDGSACLTYSGDTAPCEAVTELARDCDLFLCEATLAESERGDVKGHCTPEEAAAMAAAAEARRLLLTHFWYGTNLAKVESAGRRHYGGPLALARDGLRLDLLAHAAR